MKQRFSANWHMLERSFRKNYTMYIFLVLPIKFALSLNEVNGKVFKKITQSITIVPESLSAVVVVTMIKTLLSPSNGIINRVIEIFGGQAIFFLNSAEWFRPVYIMSHLWQQTVHITIPALFPTMSINSKLSAGLILNVAFEKILPMYTPISYKTADVLQTYVYRTAFGDFGGAG